VRVWRDTGGWRDLTDSPDQQHPRHAVLPPAAADPPDALRHGHPVSMKRGFFFAMLVNESCFGRSWSGGSRDQLRHGRLARRRDSSAPIHQVEIPLIAKHFLVCLFVFSSFLFFSFLWRAPVMVSRVERGDRM
jgi:hypothetical protein